MISPKWNPDQTLLYSTLWNTKIPKKIEPQTLPMKSIIPLWKATKLQQSLVVAEAFLSQIPLYWWNSGKKSQWLCRGWRFEILHPLPIMLPVRKNSYSWNVAKWTKNPASNLSLNHSKHSIIGVGCLIDYSSISIFSNFPIY